MGAVSLNQESFCGMGTTVTFRGTRALTSSTTSGSAPMTTGSNWAMALATARKAFWAGLSWGREGGGMCVCAPHATRGLRRQVSDTFRAALPLA